MAKFKVFVKLEGEQQTVGEMYQAPGTILRDELKSFLNRNGYDINKNEIEIEEIRTDTNDNMIIEEITDISNLNLGGLSC